MPTPRAIQAGARSHLKRYVNSDLPQQAPARIPARAAIDVRNQLFTSEAFNPKATIGGRASHAIKKYGGRTNARGIPTYASPKTGSDNGVGIFHSGRRAKARGFGDVLGKPKLKVGAKAAVHQTYSTERFW